MTNRATANVRLPEETVDSVLESITDDELLNKECHRYACELVDIGEEHDLEGLSPAQLAFYWEMYASRTRELVISALTKL